jgi:N6-adenosine-specific RNA methylase IME4
MDFPDKKYNIIYADPPWSYNDKALAGNRGACCKYDVMTLDNIKNLPIKNITYDDCILFLWITFPQLNKCFEVMESWGFKYKTVAFTWIKKYNNGKNFMGMGNWTRSNAEVCMLAIKGKPKRLNAGIRQVVESVPERHSKKPDIIREKITQLCGDLPRIELFARQNTDGWDSWGNEIDDKK